MGKKLQESFPDKEPKKMGPLDPETRLILEIYSAEFDLALKKGELYRLTCEDRFRGL